MTKTPSSEQPGWLPRVWILISQNNVEDDRNGRLIDSLMAELGDLIDRSVMESISRGADEPVYRLLSKRLENDLIAFVRSAKCLRLDFVIRTGNRTDDSRSAHRPRVDIESSRTVKGFENHFIDEKVRELSQEVSIIWLWTKEIWSI